MVAFRGPEEAEGTEEDLVGLVLEVEVGHEVVVVVLDLGVLEPGEQAEDWMTPFIVWTHRVERVLLAVGVEDEDFGVDVLVA